MYSFYDWQSLCRQKWRRLPPSCGWLPTCSRWGGSFAEVVMSRSLPGSPQQLNMFQSLRDSFGGVPGSHQSCSAWHDSHQVSKEWHQARGPQKTRPPRSLYCVSPYSVNNWMLNQDLMYLNRKVPKLLDPWVPHPSSPHHVDHLNWIPMSPHQILLHSLDSHGSICFALFFLLFHQEI